MEGHDDGDALLLGHGTQQRQQLQLVGHVQEGGGLVQHDELRLLADGPGQQNPLALAVGNGGEVPVRQVGGVDAVHGGQHLGPVLRREEAQGVGVGVAAGGHHVVARQQLAPDALGEHHRHAAAELPVGHGPHGGVRHEAVAANGGKVLGDAFQNGGFSRTIGAD